jgi:hypothetical protein
MVFYYTRYSPNLNAENTGNLAIFTSIVLGITYTRLRIRR